MASLEAIWKKARNDLVIEVEQGQEDVFLWEHAVRVARSASVIADLSPVSSRRVDAAALTAAALYHDAGWVCQFHEGVIDRGELLCRPTNDLQRELAAGLLEERLGSVLKRRTLDTAVLAVRQVNARDTTLLEAQVIGEADNLEVIGALSFWAIARRHCHEGKGIQTAIDTWRRQKEYSYWEARIADAFRFDSVRELAFQRLRRLSDFMGELERLHSGEDIAQLAGVDPSSIQMRMPSPA